MVNTAGDLFASGRGKLHGVARRVAVQFVRYEAKCGAYIELSPTGQQLFATYLPAGIVRF